MIQTIGNSTELLAFNILKLFHSFRAAMPSKIEIKISSNQQGAEKEAPLNRYESKQAIKDDQNKKAIEDIFCQLLNNCERYLCTEPESEELFEFLDPLISDSQCQIHSILIISLLLKLRDENGVPRFRNIKKLSDEDRNLLSLAVLFSALKYEEKDDVGFGINTQLMDNLGIFTGRAKVEKKYINQLKGTFNSYSIDYLKEISNGNVRNIFEACDASLRSKKTKLNLQLLPCYGSFYTLFKYMEEMSLPIVFSLIRFKVDSDEPNGRLRISSKTLLFYKFEKNKNTFVFKSRKDISEADRLQPTIAFTCYSVINKNYPEHFEDYMDGTEVPSDKFLTEDCDIRELLMLDAAGHVQLTAIDGMNDELHTEDYVKHLYDLNSNPTVKPGSNPFNGNFDLIQDNVFGCFKFHYQIAEKFGAVNTRYSFTTRINDLASEAEKAIVRRSENTFFAIEHVNVSNYARECSLLNTHMVGTGVPLVEPKILSKTKDPTFLESRLAKICSF